MKRTLTDKGIKSLKPTGKAFDVMDTEVRSFGLRVLPSGEKSFVLYRRFPGLPNPSRRSIGAYGKLSLAQARERARQWNELARQGLDPAMEEERQRQAAIDAEKKRQRHTFEATLKVYIKRKAKLRSVAVIERELRRECKDWLDLPLQDITQGQVKALIAAIVDDRAAPTQAHAVFALIRGFFTWCVNTGDYGLDVSTFEKPIKLKAKDLIGPRNRRRRTLNDFEIGAYWRSCLKLGYPFGTLFRLLLLSALRLSEAAQAEWPEVEGQPGVWVIPPAKMKGTEEDAVAHAVPLVPDIRELFESIPRFNSSNGFVFTTTIGRRPVSGFSKAKARLDAAMRADLGAQGKVFENFVLHDIRRTCRSRFSALAVQDIVRERLLAHVQEGDRKSYDHHDYLQEKAHALKLWHTGLRRIVKPKECTAVPFREPV
ncbi:MAG: integrase arm-type DNA-binding domain-containing protein [Rhodomicrobium sp.]